MDTNLANLLRARDRFRADHGVYPTHVFVSDASELPSRLYGMIVIESTDPELPEFSVGLLNVDK